MWDKFRGALLEIVMVGSLGALILGITVALGLDTTLAVIPALLGALLAALVLENRRRRSGRES